MVALLEHLHDVGFDGAPRFLGTDELGRVRLEFLDGDAGQNPSWQHDDRANATVLGRVAGLLRRLHDATDRFEPPDGAAPIRPLPLAGPIWTHGDVGYGNVVFRSDRPVGLIDWEFAAPAAPIYDPAGLLALAIRGPKPDVADNRRRAEAAEQAADAIIAGYGPEPGRTRPFSRDDLYAAAAVVLDDAADHWTAEGTNLASVDALRWRAAWFREQAPSAATG